MTTKQKYIVNGKMIPKIANLLVFVCTTLNVILDTNHAILISVII